jgi:hypothetical protein
MSFTQEELKKIKVGSILHTSWGYDQTNNDYCKILKVGQKTLKCQKVGTKTVEELKTAYGRRVLPDSNNPIGKPFNIRLNRYSKYKGFRQGDEDRISAVGSYPLGNSSDKSKIKGYWFAWDGNPDVDTER